MRRAIDVFDWDRAFVNANLNEKVFILKKTVLNIFPNFIPHETFTIDDKDPISLQKNNNEKYHPREKQCL